MPSFVKLIITLLVASASFAATAETAVVFDVHEPFVTGSLARVDVFAYDETGALVDDPTVFIDVKATLDDKRALYSQDPKNAELRLFLPLSVDRRSGDARLKVRVVTHENRLYELSENVNVVEGDYEVRKIRVPRRYVQPPKNEMKRIKAERKSIARTFEISTPKLKLDGKLTPPLNKRITSRFGLLRIYNKSKEERRHKGTDIDGKIGDEVVSCAPGRVVLVEKRYYSGDTIVIDHGQNMFSLYFHLSQFDVEEGDDVQAGQKIGLVGRSGRVTGPHLHFSIKVDGLYINPEDALTLPFF